MALEDLIANLPPEAQPGAQALVDERWVALTPSLPPGLTEAAQGLRTGFQAFEAQLAVLKVQRQVALALARTEATGAIDAVRSGLSAVTGAVRSGLNALLDDAGAYVLLVPLPKKGLGYLLAGSDAAPSTPTGALSTEVPQAVRELPAWREAFSPARLFVGGNAHFLKTLGEALFDAKDPNRPKLQSATYWGYAAVVAGSTDLGAAMALATYFAQFADKKQQGSGGLSPTRGAGDILASGVRASPSGRARLCVLDWSPIRSRPIDSTGWTAVPVEYAIIRSTGLEAATARAVLDLLPSALPTEGMTGRYGSKVLRVVLSDGIIRRYVDEETLDPATTYYYHVAVRSKLVPPGDSSDEEVVQPYTLLSSPARYRPQADRNGDARGGNPPDWYRTPSVARLLPPFDKLIDRALEALASAEAVTADGLDFGDTVISAIDSQIARLQRIEEEIQTLVGQLVNLYAVPNAGVHLCLRTGQGNASTILADLATAMSNRDDPDRPPFDAGSEYVVGIVALVAAPSEAEFLKAWALLKLLFGGSSDVDPQLAGVQSVPESTPEPAPPPDDPAPGVTFNEDMTPRPPGSGDASCD